MDNRIILTPVSLDELMIELRKVIKEELKAEQNSSQEQKFLSTKDVCNMFSPAISRPTLARYVRKGLVPQKRIAGRVWYLYGDVIQAMDKIKRYGQ